MIKRLFVPLVLVTLGVCAAFADVIQLKDKASVSGKILTEKRDQVVVDIGYTVLLVPRSQIATITRGDAGKGATAVAKPDPAPVPTPIPSPAPAPTAVTTGGLGGTSNLYSNSGTPLPERSVRELVNQLGEAVVQVRTPGGLGSGFFINDEGYLITNFHVIEGETQISLEVYHLKGGQLDRRSYKQVRIIAMNKFDDLALLKVEEPGAPRFAKVFLGQTDTLAVGERVFAIGSPMGLERTVTEGIISTKTRQMQGELYLQTTAQINPGNSGGPLFNLRGEVIGVTNMKMTFGEGLGFAIPIESVLYFLNHRDAFAYDNDNPSNAFRYLEPPRRMRKTETAAGQ